ncbi:MAG: NAD(P)H-quinone oxidoreductase subunit 4 [Cyanobacteria bacterium P01_G01_bin.67]
MITNHFPWLTTITLLPVIAALFIPLLPDKNGKTVRWYAFGVGFVDLILMTFVCWQHYDFHNPAFQLVETYSWLPQLGVSWSLGADDLSMPLVLLTGLVNTLAIFAAWQVKKKPRLFYFLVLCMYGAQIGVFLAKDLLLFFLMWELELVPVYLLISIWGGVKRRYAATKFILYTALGSIFILVAAMVIAFYGDTVTFDLEALSLKNYPLGLELFGYSAFLVAFGVKLPIFPLHTWLPDAHGEASAPISMILAGVLLKMGGYALIRFNIELLPDAHIYFAPILIVFGIVNIVYGAFAAFGQTNLKRRLAYCSVSHMGFVLVGIACFNDLGLSGAMLQMLSHGLIAAALFFLCGVAYDRTHTLWLDEMGGLAQKMPKTFALFTAGSLASLALPGMSGFVGEITVFLGLTTSDAYSSSFKVVAIFFAAVGLIVTPIYLLSMLRELFYGQETSYLKEQKIVWSDAQPREVLITACLLIPIIGIGLYPKLATQTYDVKTTEVALHEHQILAQIAPTTNLYASRDIKIAPEIPTSKNFALISVKEFDGVIASNFT